MNNGWIKIHRQIWDSPVAAKDADHLAVWIYLLTHASHKDHDVVFAGQRITLHPGQLITGRKKIAQRLKLNESKVNRVLNDFKNDYQIEQQANSRGSVISIVNWHKYQIFEQQDEQQVNSNRTATEQQVNTIQELKNIKNDQEREEDKEYNNASRAGMTIKDFFRERAKRGEFI